MFKVHVKYGINVTYLLEKILIITCNTLSSMFLALGGFEVLVTWCLLKASYIGDYRTKVNTKRKSLAVWSVMSPTAFPIRTEYNVGRVQSNDRWKEDQISENRIMNRVYNVCFQ